MAARLMPTLLVLARSLLYQALFVVWTAVLGVAYLPLLLGPRRLAQRGARFWLAGARRMQRAVLGLRWELRGGANLPAGPAVIAAKHQSAWDTMVFHALLDDPAFVLKRELLALPLVGWYLRKTGQIAIDRREGVRALRYMAERARAALAEGRQVVIFPEGHRQPPGVAGDYHPGVAVLYGAADAPVVPVAVNSGMFWRRNALMRYPGTVVIEFLPAMPSGMERRAFMDELERRIEGATRALEAEASRRHPYLPGVDKSVDKGEAASR